MQSRDLCMPGVADDLMRLRARPAEVRDGQQMLTRVCLGWHLTDEDLTLMAGDQRGRYDFLFRSFRNHLRMAPDFRAAVGAGESVRTTLRCRFDRFAGSPQLPVIYCEWDSSALPAAQTLRQARPMHDRIRRLSVKEVVRR